MSFKKVLISDLFQKCFKDRSLELLYENWTHTYLLFQRKIDEREYFEPVLLISL